MKPLASRPLLLGAFAALLAACNKAAPPSQMPPEVSVVVAHAESVPLTRELVGRLASTRVAQVRARVAGIILKRVYTEGTDVKQGQVLFQIDPAPLEADLHAAEANLAKARADAANAALIAKRYRGLATKGLLSSQDLDTAQANERTTAAAVKVAQANVEKAQLDLGYATVTAPIAGRAGRALVTEGAFVGQGEATQLTTVEQIDSIFVNFSQSVTQLQQLQQAAAPNQVEDAVHSDSDNKVEVMQSVTRQQQLQQAGGANQVKGAAHSDSDNKVEVILPDGTLYPHPGVVDFSDLAVDPRTGTVSLRAVIPNLEHRLLPGMFVNLRVTMGQLEHAFLLPQAGILRDNTGAYVLVVDTAGKVEQRRVQTHGMTPTAWIVSGDLADGDRVIVAGLQKVHPGAMARVAPVAPDAHAVPAGATTPTKP